MLPMLPVILFMSLVCQSLNERNFLMSWTLEQGKERDDAEMSLEQISGRVEQGLVHCRRNGIDSGDTQRQFEVTAFASHHKLKMI